MSLTPEEQAELDALEKEVGHAEQTHAPQTPQQVSMSANLAPLAEMINDDPGTRARIAASLAERDAMQTQREEMRITDPTGASGQYGVSQDRANSRPAGLPGQFQANMADPSGYQPGSQIGIKDTGKLRRLAELGDPEALKVLQQLKDDSKLAGFHAGMATAPMTAGLSAASPYVGGTVANALQGAVEGGVESAANLNSPKEIMSDAGMGAVIGVGASVLPAMAGGAASSAVKGLRDTNAAGAAGDIARKIRMAEADGLYQTNWKKGIVPAKGGPSLDVVDVAAAKDATAKDIYGEVLDQDAKVSARKAEVMNTATALDAKRPPKTAQPVISELEEALAKGKNVNRSGVADPNAPISELQNQIDGLTEEVSTLKDPGFDMSIERKLVKERRPAMLNSSELEDRIGTASAAARNKPFEADVHDKVAAGLRGLRHPEVAGQMEETAKEVGRIQSVKSTLGVGQTDKALKGQDPQTLQAITDRLNSLTKPESDALNKAVADLASRNPELARKVKKTQSMLAASELKAGAPDESVRPNARVSGSGISGYMSNIFKGPLNRDPAMRWIAKQTGVSLKAPLGAAGSAVTDKSNKIGGSEIKNLTDEETIQLRKFVEDLNSKESQ